ncbi:hypothetical protein N0V92_004830, partial [Colletotrichum tropicale]
LLRAAADTMAVVDEALGLLRLLLVKPPCPRHPLLQPATDRRPYQPVRAPTPPMPPQQPPHQHPRRSTRPQGLRPNTEPRASVSHWRRVCSLPSLLSSREARSTRLYCRQLRVSPERSSRTTRSSRAKRRRHERSLTLSRTSCARACRYGISLRWSPRHGGRGSILVSRASRVWPERAWEVPRS